MENLKSEIEKTLAVLKRGGLILYPTDTVWGIGCDSSNPEAIDKIYKLKQREDSKSMICLVHDFKMLNQFVEEILAQIQFNSNSIEIENNDLDLIASKIKNISITDLQNFNIC